MRCCHSCDTGTFAERDINERACAYSLILDHRTSLEHPLGEAVDVLLTREAAERFIAEVRSDEGELARLAPLT